MWKWRFEGETKRKAKIGDVLSVYLHQIIALSKTRHEGKVNRFKLPFQFVGKPVHYLNLVQSVTNRRLRTWSDEEKRCVSTHFINRISTCSLRLSFKALAAFDVNVRHLSKNFSRRIKYVKRKGQMKFFSSMSNEGWQDEFVGWTDAISTATRYADLFSSFSLLIIRQDIKRMKFSRFSPLEERWWWWWREEMTSTPR